jgi:hypothetical protein
MRRWVITTLVTLVLAGGAAACSSGSSSSGSSASGGASGATSAAASSPGAKSAFCADNVTLDKAGASVTTPAAFLNALEGEQSVIDDFAAHIPDGSIRPEAQALVDAVRHAVAANDASAFGQPSLQADGAAVDTYCGVDGSGNPLPADFAQGKGSAFCSDEAFLSNGVSSAQAASGIVTFLQANQAKVDDFAAHIPPAVQADAQTLVDAARAAVASNDGTKLQTDAISTASTDVDLYCGVNH